MLRPWTSPGLADDLPHFPHVRKSGLKVPDLENHSKKCKNGPKRAENDADDVAGASEAADTSPMSLRKVRKVALPRFENSKTKAQQSS